MTQDLIDKIGAQAVQEIDKARIFKQGKIKNWVKNEEMYYGSKKILLESRSSVQLSRMQEFVHTLLSKIDNPLVFKYKKRKNAQTKRVDYLNGLRQIDAARDFWDMKDLLGKKQAIIYGRAIYCYYADSVKGKYRPHLENIDVYDFLIDPGAGGADIEKAMYLGSYSVELTKFDLRQGAKDGLYIKKAVRELTAGAGNASDMTQEETNKQNRTQDQGTIGRTTLAQSKDKYKFWRWFTTYEGERYHLLMTNSGQVIRCEPMADILPVSEEYPKGLWPFWTWAAFPDLTEFWTPSYCDFVRELFMAQDVAINQTLDNGEAINKPMRAVVVTALDNMQELKYRRDGLIKFKGDVDVNKVYQTVATPSINTGIEIFNLLESIQEKASGVTSQQKGVEDVNGKVGIYEGNQAAAADRFGLLNKSYSFGYSRFAELYQMGVKDNLVRREAIEISGPNGIEIEEVRRSDIFKRGDSFGVMVEASNAELMASEQQKRDKGQFLVSQLASPVPTVNRKKATEKLAEIAGFKQEEIDDLFDVSVYGNAALIADADADIEAILLGEAVRPNRKANNAYKQHIVNFMMNHDKKLSNEMFRRLTDYVTAIGEIVMANEVRAMNEEITAMKTKQMMLQASGMMPPATPGTPQVPGMVQKMPVPGTRPGAQPSALSPQPEPQPMQ